MYVDDKIVYLFYSLLFPLFHKLIYSIYNIKTPLLISLISLVINFLLVLSLGPTMGTSKTGNT